MWKGKPVGVERENAGRKPYRLVGLEGFLEFQDEKLEVLPISTRKTYL